MELVSENLDHLFEQAKAAFIRAGRDLMNLDTGKKRNLTVAATFNFINSKVRDVVELFKESK